MSSLLDGGTYPQQVLDALAAKVRALPTAPALDFGDGCEVVSYRADGSVLSRSSLTAAGQLAQVQRFTADGALVSETVRTFDDAGHELSRDDMRDGGVDAIRWTYDPSGKVSSVDGAGTRWTVSWRDGSQLASWSSEGALTGERLWTFDARGLPLQSSGSFASGGGTTREAETYLYRADGTLESRQFVEDGGEARAWSLAYDAQGRLTRAVDGADDTAFDYDDAGRLASERIETGDGGVTLKRWLFDAQGRAVVEASEGEIVLRAFTADGALGMEEVDLDGDCVAEASHVLQRDPAGTLRVELFDTAAIPASDGAVLRLYVGTGCPRDASPFPGLLTPPQLPAEPDAFWTGWY